MFYFWLRRTVRKFTNPIPLKDAERYSNLFTKLYLLSGIGLFTSVLFYYLNERRRLRAIDPMWDVNNAGVYYGRRMGAQNMQIYVMNNGHLEKKGVYKREEDVEEDDFFGSPEEVDSDSKPKPS